MKGKQTWKTHVLTSNQIKLLRELCPVVKERFFLAGGTAIALYFGHRLSIDLDFFSLQGFIPSNLLSKLTEKKIKILQLEKETLHLLIQNTKVSFLCFPYPLLEPLKEIELFSCKIASAKDLAAMKLLAISQRGSKRDFIDLYAFLQEGFQQKKIFR